MKHESNIIDEYLEIFKDIYGSQDSKPPEKGKNTYSDLRGDVRFVLLDPVKLKEG